MSKILNIYIPSYNRPEICLDTIRKLIIQIKVYKNVRINVLDNCSKVKYKEFFLDKNDVAEYINQKKLIIKRNNVNIGMSANILRCFEDSCSRDGWLWILSDDDYIKDNAIEIIQKSIDEADERVSFLKYSSNRIKHNNNFIIETSRDLIKFISNNPKIRFNSYIFLTNIVYKIDSIKPAIADAYDFTLSHVPHFILLNLSLSKKSILMHQSNELAIYRRPKVGYSYGLFSGIQIGAIKPIIINDFSLRDFHYIFQVHHDMKVAIDLYYELLSYNLTQKLITYLLIYWINLIFSKCYLRGLLFIPISLIMVNKISRKIVLILLSKSKYASEINEIKARYSINY